MLPLEVNGKRIFLDVYEATQRRIETNCLPAANSELPLSDISPAEAKSWCQQRGLRLPTKEEWLAAAEKEKTVLGNGNIEKCVNVCDKPCWEAALESVQGIKSPLETGSWFKHSDGYIGVSKIGASMATCGVKQDFIDIHGNMREVVQQGEDYLACGLSYRINELSGGEKYACGDLAAEYEAEKKPFNKAGGKDNYKTEYKHDEIGFRCAKDG